LTRKNPGGILHIGFEGYYVMNAHEITSQQGLWAQLWKEYAMSDSRYLTVDSRVLCLEVITVVCVIHGHMHICTYIDIWSSLANPTFVGVACVGTTFTSRSTVDSSKRSPKTCDANRGVYGPSLRLRFVLCHQYCRALRRGTTVLEARATVLLGVLCGSECAMDHCSDL
jgi:hypothetical protein